MFCPKCGTENEGAQSYCRRCGQSLAAIRLSLEGRVDDAAAVLHKANKPLVLGLAALSIFCLITVVTLWTGGRLGWANALSAIGFLGVVTPPVLIGIVRFRRANRLLKASVHGNELQTSKTDTTNLSGSKTPPEISATEDTTMRLG
jgi:zinc-ribbon domain